MKMVFGWKVNTFEDKRRYDKYSVQIKRKELNFYTPNGTKI